MKTKNLIYFINENSYRFKFYVIDDQEFNLNDCLTFLLKNNDSYWTINSTLEKDSLIINK